MMNQMINKLPRIAFAGDRDISVRVLDFILASDLTPLALMVPEKSKASHVDELINRCPFLTHDKILFGAAFRSVEGIKLLSELNLDYIIGIHFPFIFPPEVLSIPKIGVLNLHPAYLPHNRGWHTPSWAIMDETPYGATLHFMDSGLDTGDIVHQKNINISPSDTANTLYQRLKKLELLVFMEGWAKLLADTYVRTRQDLSSGISHKKEELFNKTIQEIKLNDLVKADDLIKKLRALTTNKIEEAAYYRVGNKRYRIQVIIHEEEIGNKQ